ncbi:hypothetical protein MHIR_DE00421 [Candidatus Doolittlea endobia]|uniref:Uncharacterized protein n=1 Tax=Candidatus Doolittlea endobia TaxID=1778262 RepID=A0A143WS99_9ENTR|nr:hypothetical protein MHIR_DE00421 [Candidatus Doolittlea endobia]
MMLQADIQEMFRLKRCIVFSFNSYERTGLFCK